MYFILVWLWASASAACAFDFWTSASKNQPPRHRIFGAVLLAVVAPPFVPFFIIARLLKDTK